LIRAVLNEAQFLSPAVKISSPDCLELDPAFGSGPLATVIQDLLSILIYFAIATTIIQ
jgi:cation transporter-like permease